VEVDKVVVEAILSTCLFRSYLAFPGRKERKRKKNGKTQKIVPRGPGRPRGESSIIGIPKSKTITLGDPGCPEGIPRVEGIPM